MLSIHEAISLEDLAKDNKIVWYEEIAQYSSRYMYRDSRYSLGSIDNEVLYHLNTLTMLSLYFDKIIIPTSALFNSTDRTIRNIALAIIRSSRFKTMLQVGAVKICGWGSKTPYEMFNNAKEFIAPLSLNKNNESVEFFFKMARVFNSDNMTFRTSSGTPDDDETKIFREKINRSAFLTQDMVRKIEIPINRSEKLLGMLTYAAFIQGLERLGFDDRVNKSILSTYYQSWLTNINMNNTAIYMYINGLDQMSIEHTIKIENRSIYTFLYSPRIFERVLARYLTEKEVFKFKKMPYTVLNSLKNGDWERFKLAYHSSLEEISERIKDVHIQPISIDSDDIWAEKILDEISSNSFYDFDISIFLQSLSGIMGMAVGVPILHHVFNAISSTFGKRSLERAQSWTTNKSIIPSPFINKLKSQLQSL